MLQAVTIARPYANAIFKLAVQNNCIQFWQKVLQDLALIMQNSDMISYVNNPNFSKATLKKDLKQLLQEQSNELDNFLDILIANKRLLVLPQILEYFEKLLTQHQGTSDVLIESAYKLTAIQKNTFVKYLEARFNRKLNATVKIVPELIGGIRAFVGDEVLDYSVKAHLANMKASIIA